MGLAQGSEMLVKILVAGVGHLEGKRKRIGLVCLYERAYERVVSQVTINEKR